MNQFMVGAQGEGVVVLRATALLRPITNEEALNLAVWLVLVAGMDGPELERALAEARAS